MNRYTCKYCGKKRTADKLRKVVEPVSKKTSWICLEHTSILSDVEHIRDASEKPLFVELFAGSKHISQEAERRGFDVFNLDYNPKFGCSFSGDICNFHPSRSADLRGRSVAVLWASIPCTVYSILNLESHWDKVSVGYRQYYYVPKSKEAIQALRILYKTISIIRELNPVYYFLENPRGALRHFPQVKLIPYRHTVSYADYGFEVYKPTDIFTNCPDFRPISVRSAMGRTFVGDIQRMNNAYERSLIPPGLITEVFNSFSFKFISPDVDARPPALYPGRTVSPPGSADPGQSVSFAGPGGFLPGSADPNQAS